MTPILPRDTLAEVIKELRGRLPKIDAAPPEPKRAVANLGRKPASETLRFYYDATLGRFTINNSNSNGSDFTLAQLNAWAQAHLAEHPELNGNFDVYVLSEDRRGEYPVVEVTMPISDAEWDSRVAKKQLELDNAFEVYMNAYRVSKEQRTNQRVQRAERTKEIIGSLMPSVCEHLRAYLELRGSKNASVVEKFEESTIEYFLEVSSDDNRHDLGHKIPHYDPYGENSRCWMGFRIRLAKNSGRFSDVVEPGKPNDLELI